MKIPKLFACNLALFIAATLSLSAADQANRLSAKSGSKMRIEGTSSLHDWQVESPLIGGFIDVGQNFPTEPGQDLKPGKSDAHVEAFITVRSLRSVEKNGTFYSDKMDEIMWEKFKPKEYPKILFRSTELTLKEVPKSKDAPYVFDAKGDLALAGVTNNISMVVNVLPLGDKKLKISGVYPTKMSAFKMQPETIGLGIVKTGDDVKLIFDWMVGPAKTVPAAAAK